MQRIPALDGLRALAIAMVIGYHIDSDVVPAGYWGVIVFFVLSGYLITRLLSDEVDRSGGVDLRRFYLKRGLRLLPALAIFSLVLLVVTGTDWRAVTATLGFNANYARIGGLELGMLTHTWFIAVLAHFYLVWPIVIGAVPGRHRLRVVGVLAVAFIAWRAIAIVFMSPSWVYNATDTNAAAILAGSWLGVARLRPWPWARWSVPTLLALMLLPQFGVPGPAFLWGGFVALALGILTVQYATARPAWLEGTVIVWLGTISYGLYLWHYLFVRSEVFPMWATIPVSVAAAAASWYLLERPAQRWGSRLRKRHVVESEQSEQSKEPLPSSLAPLRRAERRSTSRPAHPLLGAGA